LSFVLCTFSFLSPSFCFAVCFANSSVLSSVVLENSSRLSVCTRPPSLASDSTLWETYRTSCTTFSVLNL
jgi:hypothetical protein